ncbi:hypothetical protein [Burkholderia gladioli]|uniref:hypothetical protein n=1 Tax=Burkholderia gladioli TaxID=28095 RepID=UPI000A985A76|nr:hypothetical protein [Burkholderia gladioli]
MEESKPSNNSESVGMAMLRADVFAQGCMIRALVSSHPDKETLKQHFLHYTEQYLSATLAGEASDISIRAFEMSVEQLLRFMR